MTTALELVRKARALGATLSTDGDRLELDVPVDFPDDLVEELRAHKASILSFLVLPEEVRPVVAWAAWLVERIPGDEVEIQFQETPHRAVRLKLSELGRYLTQLLRALALLQSWAAASSADTWPDQPGWRQQQIDELCGTLANLREALRPLGLAEIKERAA